MPRQTLLTIVSLTCVMFVSCPMAWSWQEVRDADVSAIEQITKGFGSITNYRSNADIGVTIFKAPNPGLVESPKTLRDLITVADFDARIDDEGVDLTFRSFPRIKRLTIMPKAWNPQIAKSATKHNQIEQLWATDCNIPAADCQWIGRISSLQVLMLYGNPDLGDSVGDLAALSHLRQLCLANTGRASPANLSWIANNRELRTLWLSGRSINDEIIPILKKLPNLANLSAIDTEITKSGREQLQAVGSIKILHVK